MPQTPERKRQYAKERRERLGQTLKDQQAEWRDKNRGRIRENCKKRRLEKRAMCLVAAARVRSRRKGVPFSLDRTDIATLQNTIDSGKCELTGAAFILDAGRCATSPSLDRIVPALGYVRGNVRIICHAINVGLGEWGETELYRIFKSWEARLEP